MFLKCFVALTVSFQLSYGVRYDYFSSKPASKSLLKYYEEHNVLDVCTTDIKPCEPDEWRRLDGSCNNLEQPAKSTYFVPMTRLLKAHYHNGNEPRKAQDGGDLMLPRVVRTTILKTGKCSHPELNQQVPGFGAYMLMDFASIHDIEKMLLEKTDCCEPEHMNDPECTPNIIPEDDPVHRFSGIRCMNLTRPQTYQDFHCTQEEVPSLIIRATPSIDGSPIYNQFNDGEKTRAYVGGLLLTEEENGRQWPPTGPRGLCLLNQADETRCYQNHLNTVLPIHIFTLWFVRNHNEIAKTLSSINPHWDDETCYQHARNINIAFIQQMYYYEWLSALIGRDNLIEAGVLGDSDGFRETYDKNLYPEISLECNYALRWFHTLLEGTAKLYDKEGQYVDDMPLFEILFRTGWLPKGRNEEYVTQGFMRQPCHDTDHSIDYDVGERGLPLVQKALDLTTSDIAKNRLFGLAPFVDYVHLFTGKNVTCFEDLEPLVSPKMIPQLKKAYKHVKDIDLMAGLWAGKPMKGGRIPLILAEILIDTWRKVIRGDRHHFERKDRPHAFTLRQLLEMRKASMARLMCNVGHTVTETPLHGFLNVGPDNPMVKCENLPQIDYTAWKSEA